ncbi:MAG: SIR2 family NAD-dependent protein deacylase [Flavobacterium sp.]
MKKLVVLSGAGMSAESGISTFRDAGGLWEGHDIMEVASPEGWSKNPEVVLNFYNLRRRQLKEVHPNKGHLILKDLEKYFDVQIITQNVDNLHERAGSSNVLHLHGELNKVRSINDENHILDWTEDLHWGDTDARGHQLRPHIVWFGEAVPAIELAANLVSNADIIVIIGTSMQVYPAAGLIDYAPDDAKFFYIDPQPAHLPYFHHKLTIIPKTASEGCQDLKEILGVIS